METTEGVQRCSRKSGAVKAEAASESTEELRREAVQMLLGNVNNSNAPVRSLIRLMRASASWKSSCPASNANATVRKTRLFSAARRNRRVRRY